MENIIDKLRNSDINELLNNWSNDEHKQLLELYLLISKQESKIFKLVYRYHGCDSWEDIFRDYDRRYLRDKVSGVKEALTLCKHYTKNTEEDESGEDSDNGSDNK